MAVVLTVVYGHNKKRESQLWFSRFLLLVMSRARIAFILVLATISEPKFVLRARTEHG